MEEKANMILKNTIKAGVPERFSSRVFGNYDAKTNPQAHAKSAAWLYAKNFPDVLKAGTSMIFCGSPGTGKTHLACAVANHITAQGYEPLFISIIKAVRRVKETYRRDSKVTEQQVIDHFVSFDLLILDEVGVQFGSKAEEIIVFEIINTRYEKMKPTLIISNLPPGGMAKYLGPRVVDRMKENDGAVVAFDWISHR